MNPWKNAITGTMLVVGTVMMCIGLLYAGEKAFVGLFAAGGVVTMFGWIARKDE